METIIAIDPSINFTGWCIACDGEILESGIIRTDKESTDADKLYALYCELDKIAGANCSISPATKIPFLAIVEIPESFAYGRSSGRYGKQLNVQSLFKLSRAVGVILATCKRHGMECIEVGATKWKGNMNKWVSKTITGKKDDNEADAILLAQFYFRMKKGGIKI